MRRSRPPAALVTGLATKVRPSPIVWAWQPGGRLPPQEWLPATVAVKPIVLYASARLVMVLHHLAAWPGGFSFELTCGFPQHLHDRMSLELADPQAPDRLRAGLQLEDGTRVTGRMFGENWPEGDWETAVLVEESADASDEHMSRAFTARLTPSPGELAFVCQWPAHGLALTRARLEGGTIREAMDRALRAWPER